MPAPSTAYRNEIRKLKPLKKFSTQFLEQEYESFVAKEVGSGALQITALIGIPLGLFVAVMSIGSNVFGVATGACWLISGIAAIVGFNNSKVRGVNRGYMPLKVGVASCIALGVVLSAGSNYAVQSAVLYLPLALLAQAMVLPAIYFVASIAGFSVFHLLFSVVSSDFPTGIAVVLSGASVAATLVMIDAIWRKSYLTNMLYRSEMVINPTTLVGNSNMFLSHLERVRSWGERARTSTSILFFKIDYEEQYRLKYSDTKLEELKIKIAKEMSDHCTRPLDEFCHIDNDYFAMIAFGCTKEGSIALAKRMQEKVKGLSIPTKVSPKSPVITISVGVVYVPHELQTATRILIKQGKQVATEAEKAKSSLKCAMAIGSNKIITTSKQAAEKGSISPESVSTPDNKDANKSVTDSIASLGDSVISIGAART